MISLTLSPFSMEISRVWSSSFIQTKTFSSLLWKMPESHCENTLVGTAEFTSSIGPVSATTGAQQKSRIRLLEEVAPLTEVLFFLRWHSIWLLSEWSGSSKRKVISSEIAFELLETLDHQSFYFPSLVKRTAGRKTKASKRSAWSTINYATPEYTVFANLFGSVKSEHICQSGRSLYHY